MKKYFISILGICFVLCSQASDVRAVDSNVTYREEISYYGAANIITSQPTSVNANAGDTVHFKVSVNDSRAAYQWQYRLKGENEWKTPGASSAKTADYSFSAMEYFDGMSVRCVVTTGSGKLVSSEASLSVAKKVQITSQPTSVNANAGDTVHFKVSVNDSRAAYQWQYRLKGESEWKTPGASSAKTADYSFSAMEYFDGMSVRCVVTTGSGKLVSSEASLSVAKKVQITSQPTSVNANAGDTVHFKVSVNDSRAAYQWQYRLKGENEWKTPGASSAKTADYSFSAMEYFDGMSVRCVLTTGSGKLVSSEASLSVAKKVQITSQPTSVNANAGDTVHFKVSVNDSRAAYQWQYRLKGENEWKTPGASSAKTADYSFSAMEYFDGMSVRCVVTTGSGKLVSSEASLSVAKKVQITSQPTSVNANAGDTVHFKVSVNDSRAAYQWQYRLKGENEWKTPGASSAKTADYSFSAMEYFDGMSVRCVLTTGSGKLVSSEASLSVAKKVQITSQPTSVNANAGDTVHFKVSVNDSRAAYQWQYRLKGESEWKTPGASSAKTADYSFSAMEYFDGMSVRCVLTTGSGKLVSSEASLSVAKKVQITSQPTSVNANAGDTVHFKVSVNDSRAAYQWQYRLKGESEWKTPGASSAKTADYSFSAMEYFDGMSVRCVVTNGSGKLVSNEAVLYILKREDWELPIL